MEINEEIFKNYFLFGDDELNLLRYPHEVYWITFNVGRYHQGNEVPLKFSVFLSVTAGN